jgi:hypothetical protein
MSKSTIDPGLIELFLRVCRPTPEQRADQLRRDRERMDAILQKAERDTRPFHGITTKGENDE